MVKALTAIFALIALNTEILSLFSAITARNMLAIWLSENILLTGWLIFRNRKGNADPLRSLHGIFSGNRRKIAEHKSYIIVLILIYAGVFLIALFSAPNTIDSLTYHMARVANWIQWGNVNFYATSTLRQLYSNPLAEYGLLNIFLLTGSDRLVNLLQFTCLIGCGLMVSLIAKEFKQTGIVQILAMLLTATIPMAILQASSTQNDLVVSFLALGFFLFYLRASQSVGKSDLIFSGLIAGLAFLTKGTSYIYCFSMAAVIFASLFFNRSSPKNKLSFFAQSLIVLVIAVSMNSIQYARNYQLFGLPIATGDESYSNKNPTLKMMIANVVRNYSVHLGILFEDPNEWVNEATAFLVGDELNNPNSSFMEMKFGIKYSDHEDDAGNFIQILLLTVCLLAIWKLKGEDRRMVLIGTLTIIVGFLLFSSLLRWNPWLSRLHLPFFMLGCVVIASIFGKYGENVRNILLAICLFSSVNALILGQPRSILTAINSISDGMPREKQYFANQLDVSNIYFEAVSMIKKNNPQEIGLMMESDYKKYTFGDLEYPVWLLLKGDLAGKPLIRHVGIKNISSRLDTQPMPEWVISDGNEKLLNGVQYDEVWSKEPMHILKKRGD